MIDRDDLKRTPEQIEAEINGLLAIRPKVPRITWGDNNHFAIDAQIKVLQKLMDDDEIEDEWGDDQNRRNHGNYAWEWLTSDDDYSLVDDWKDLI